MIYNHSLHHLLGGSTYYKIEWYRLLLILKFLYDAWEFRCIFNKVRKFVNEKRESLIGPTAKGCQDAFPVGIMYCIETYKPVSYQPCNSVSLGSTFALVCYKINIILLHDLLQQTGFTKSTPSIKYD